MNHFPKNKPPRSDQMSEEKTPQPLKIEILEKISTLMTAAFGFVAAFAWNETFKVVFLSRVEEDATGLMLIGYSLIITVIAVLLTITVARASGRAKRKLE